MMMYIKNIRSLDLDKICVAGNKVLIVCNGESWHTINGTLKNIFFLKGI